MAPRGVLAAIRLNDSSNDFAAVQVPLALPADLLRLAVHGRQAAPRRRNQSQQIRRDDSPCAGAGHPRTAV